MMHLTFEEISELAEHGADETGSPHFAECGPCRETLRRVRALLTTTRALPREVEPPQEAWDALRERLGQHRAAATKRWWHNGWLATAAGIVLVIGTAIITSNTPRAKAAKLPSAAAGLATPVAPAALRAVDMNYVETVARLREALDGQRGALAPSTARTVDRALAVIDSAIAEARAALASDPANAALVDILSTHYERKVELLQRATELSTL
jgi:hypothetical protein